MAVFVLNAMRMASAAKAEETEEALRREIGMIESHLSPALLSLVIL